VRREQQLDIYPTKQINKHPIIGELNTLTSGLNIYPIVGLLNDVISGENINGRLHKPNSGRLAAGADHQYATGRFGLPTLSSRRLDVEWQRIDRILPSLARPGLVSGFEDGDRSMRWPNRSTSGNAQEASAAGTGPGRSTGGASGTSSRSIGVSQWDKYVAAKSKNAATRSTAVEDLRGVHKTQRSELASNHKSERNSLWRDRASPAERSLLAAQQTRERLELRDRTRSELKQVRLEHKFPNFKDWKLKKGLKPAEFTGQDMPARKADIRDYTGEIAGRCVHYIDVHGTRSFTDTGKKIVVHDSGDKAAILAALQLAGQKFGQRFEISGPREFKETVCHVAAESGIRLQDETLQKRVESIAAEIKKTKEKEALNVSVRNHAAQAIGRAHEVARSTSQQVDAAIDRAKRSALEADRGVSHAAATASSSVDKVGAACEQADRAIPRIKQRMDDELEKFKLNVSIADLAASYGWEHDKKQSYKTAICLRKGGDKLYVTRIKASGHDMFHLWNGPTHIKSGSVVDFVKDEVNDNNAKLVRVRQELRGWLPEAKKPAVKKPAVEYRPVPVEKDLEKIVLQHAQMQPYAPARNYLVDERKLNPKVIQAFGVLQNGPHNNAVFPHVDKSGNVTGWEEKNRPPRGSTRAWTSFADGGVHGLYQVKVGTGPVQKIVVVEAAIDALSHAQLHFKKGDSTLYLSTGGTISDEQKEQLRELFAQHKTATVVLAMDNDLTDKKGQPLEFDRRPGELAAAKVRGLVAEGQAVERHTPAGKDFNDDLKALQAQIEREQVHQAHIEQQRQQQEREHGIGR
jgi:hypothetical protein